MRPYVSVFVTRMRVLFQYRAAALAGLVTQLFWGFIRVMIFTAFYQNASGEMPMTLQQTTDYVWLGQALLLLIPWSLDVEVVTAIRTGNVAYELVRPASIYWMWYARTAAMRLAPVFLRGVILILVAWTAFGLSLPPTPGAVFAFLISLCGSLVLGSAISTALTMTMFWTITSDGIMRLVPSLIFILSGMVVPLPLFPDWAQPILNALPFRNIIDVPIRLYLGHIPASELPFILAQQTAWAVGFVLLGHVLMSRGLRRVVTQGG
jgi:ABC-2 type transport system permease protein